jgi:DNA polymerase V
MNSPVFALVDVNNFYASCEQLWEPRLRNRPVVVLSNNDGCVVARSKEAKAIGVPMGAPWFKLRALARLHGIVALSSNYELYADMSNRVVEVLRDFTPELEVYSIDESFLSLGGMSSVCQGSLAEYGQKIRQRIACWVGLPVCVGIGSTKTRAKFANHVAKKNAQFGGVCDLEALGANEQDDWMTRIDVGEVWGVGRRISKKLEDLGIRSVLDLKQADPQAMRKQFSVVLERTVMELRGCSCMPLELMAPDKQQIMSSRSFGKPVYDPAELREAVSTYVCRAAQKLRAQHSVAGALTVGIMTNQFKPDEPQYSRSVVIPLPEPSADSRVLVAYALRMLEHIYRPGYAYKKAAVMLSDLSPESQRQVALWQDEVEDWGRERSARLSGLLDEVNARFGRGTLHIASTGTQTAWSMKRERVTPHYTTRWSDVPIVMA